MRFENILEWYSGKALETIKNFTIPALVESETQGYWKKGVSRTVYATLNKMNVAQKWARATEKKFGEHSFGSFRMPTNHPLYDVQSAMLYGSFGHAPKLLATLRLLKPSMTNYAPQLIESAMWAKAFAPIAELVTLLDSRRPKPTYVFKTLSPTVVANVSKVIGIDITTIRVPPMHGEWQEVEKLVKGKLVKQTAWVVVIDWPEGTKHCQSRFAFGSKAGNQQCEACGHAIRDPWNWLPILADVFSAERYSVSLWVGRDCAKKLFGCQVDGDAIYKNRGAP